MPLITVLVDSFRQGAFFVVLDYCEHLLAEYVDLAVAPEVAVQPVA
jgi:hypothetical protein